MPLTYHDIVARGGWWSLSGHLPTSPPCSVECDCDERCRAWVEPGEPCGAPAEHRLRVLNVLDIEDEEDVFLCRTHLSKHREPDDIRIVR